MGKQLRDAPPLLVLHRHLLTVKHKAALLLAAVQSGVTLADPLGRLRSCSAA